MQFPISDISSDRTAGTIPSSGSVSFYLKVFNAEHASTTPVDYTLTVNPVSQSWQPGDGLDLENYSDKTRGNRGSNWMSASNSVRWQTAVPDIRPSIGGSYITSSTDFIYEQTFTTGLEDLDINITAMVESWMASTIENYGVLIKLSASFEGSASLAQKTEQDDLGNAGVIVNDDGATKSYYTKRFFAKGTEFFFKKPVIEARWNDSKKDDRGSFFFSSSLAPAEDNLNTLYLYNYVRGALTNIPGIGAGDPIYVDLYSGSADNTGPTGSALIQSVQTPATGGFVSTGIYSCSVCLTAAANPVDPLFDVWYSGSVEYFTGSINTKTLAAAQTISKPIYFLNITNLQSGYRSDQTARFNLYIREKNWNPTIYNVATATAPTTTIESASYRVYRTLDGLEAIPHGTGSDLHTLLSHDVSGNYFDFDMNNLQPGFEYAFKFAFYDSHMNSWTEQNETFKFRVEEYEY